MKLATDCDIVKNNQDPETPKIPLAQIYEGLHQRPAARMKAKIGVCACPTILVVEDDETDLYLLRRAFRQARIANPLVELRDGADAIDYFSGKGSYTDRNKFPIPSMVLLDLRMPRLSGFAVLEAIRAETKFDEVVLVVLSASDDVQDVNQARKLGANSYMVKPGNLNDLAQWIKRLQGVGLSIDTPSPAINEPENGLLRQEADAASSSSPSS